VRVAASLTVSAVARKTGLSRDEAATLVRSLPAIRASMQRFGGRPLARPAAGG
jgi:DNA-binding phage protein